MPRILTFDENCNLKITPAEELKKLRESHIEHRNILIKENSDLFLGNFPNLTLEIIASFELDVNEIFGFILFHSEQNNGEMIEFDSNKSKITVGGENGRLNKKLLSKNITFHIFIDRSIVEVFINHQDCITSRIYSSSTNSNGFSVYSKQGLIHLKKLDVWNLKTIW